MNWILTEKVWSGARDNDQCQSNDKLRFSRVSAILPIIKIQQTNRKPVKKSAIKRLFFYLAGQINITTGRRLLDCSLTECLIKKEKLSGSLLLVRNILSKLLKNIQQR